MRQGSIAGLGLVALLGGFLTTPAMSEVIFEDKGLYKKDRWNIQRHYDDLDDPRDAPGIITRGRDPDSPSGPAPDFETRPGSLEVEEE
jgi:hypothetical protein